VLKGNAVKNIVPYPQVKYNQFLYNNDIALIELGEPLVFSRNVSAVCLPKQPIQVYFRLNSLIRVIANCYLINAFLISNAMIFQPRQICVTAGWGFLMNEEMNLQQYVKFLSVPTNDSDKCNATSHYAGFITEHDICMDKGPCYVSLTLQKMERSFL